MIAKITEGVKVSVETVYQAEYSNPAGEHFMFAYRIRIENLSDYAIQLIRRHWFIFDSNGSHREVEGDGVVGLQPIIKPGLSHEYVSACNLKTEIGLMHGTYEMIRLADLTSFTVNIPEFHLIASYKLN